MAAAAYASIDRHRLMRNDDFTQRQHTIRRAYISYNATPFASFALSEYIDDFDFA